jgi:phosphonate transport system substrate-binding protein
MREVTDLLFEETGLYVEANVVADYTALIEAMCSSPPEVQMGVLPPFSYILAAERGCAEAALVADRFGRPVYNGQILVRANSGISTIADLAGKTFCRPDPLSTSGWIIPYLTMRANGLDPETDLAAITDSGSHDTVVIEIYNGNCAAGSTYVDARTVIEAEYPDVMDNVTVLEVSADIPNDGIQFNPSMPQALRDQIVAGLLAVIETDAGGAALETMFSWNGLEEYGDAFYDPLRAELQSAGMRAEDFLE